MTSVITPMHHADTSAHGSRPGTQRRRSFRRWAVVLLVGTIVILVMRQVLDPYDDRGYMAVPHGDHTHYVPKDWDRSVPMSNFPVVYPAPDQRILPDGRVVAADR